MFSFEIANIKKSGYIDNVSNNASLCHYLCHYTKDVCFLRNDGGEKSLTLLTASIFSQAYFNPLFPTIHEEQPIVGAPGDIPID